MSLLVTFKSKVPFQDIDGKPYCLWQYQITGTSTSDGVVAKLEGLVSQVGHGLHMAATGNAGGAAAPGAGRQVGLGFSGRLDIKDPSLYPNVSELKDTHLEKPVGEGLQFISTGAPQPGIDVLDIHFVAPCAEDPFTPIALFATGVDGKRESPPFRVSPDGTDNTVQATRGPAVVCTDQATGITRTNGQPAGDFAGTLPYASEIFGVYQPLAGWLGQRTSQRIASFTPASGSQGAAAGTFGGGGARLSGPAVLHAAGIRFAGASQGVLSPVGLVTLFREYFFEFDNFLGSPSGHIWISPGGTVEVIESSTRRTLVEKTASQLEATTSKVEESLTSQDDVADAVKEDNANDTKLGASASAGGKFAGIYHADASASFSNQATTHKSSELTHKHTRTQSAKVSSEIHRNFQTTFKTVTEATDVTSRRYVVQNTTNQLVNYELRRKMRKVGVQVQHIGTRLSWQVFLDAPGKDLGLGELVHVVPAPDLSSLKKPEPPPPLQPKDTEFADVFTLQRFPGTKNDPHQDANYTRSTENPGGLTGMHSDNNDDHVVGDFEYNAPPPSPGYILTSIRTVSAKTQSGGAQFRAHYDIPTASAGRFTLKADFLNFGGGRIINFTLALTWSPPAVDPAEARYQADLVAYNAQVADLQRRAYGAATRERINLVSGLRRRPSEDLREEERQTVYGRLIHDLQLFEEPHIGSELIRQIFDVDEMLYFAAPDYWRPSTGVVPPRTATSVGKFPVPPVPAVLPSGAAPADPLDGETVGGWYSHTEKDNALDPMGKAQPEWRIDYLLTEASQPAPFGSSLGWLVEIDGDERRNEFLNAAWVKAVLPVRPGHELEALDWLAQAKVEGEDGLSQPYPFQPGDPAGYQGKTLSEVLQLLASELQTSNTDIKNTLATEKVFETGFDPLATGFRPAEPYMIFDEWLEVLPTDQIVALEVHYDPKTGKHI